MSSSKTQDQYPNALEVICQITNLTQGKDCIYRGESSINFEYPCSSTLYRQLKKANATKSSTPRILKERQNKLIERMRPHEEEGQNDLERLMSCQNYGALTNLLDFTESADVALFFACWKNDDHDGRVIVKPRDVFEELVVRDDSTLPDDRKIFMKPQKTLRRAKDQEGLLVHSPSGFIPFGDEDVVVIKREWKQEILSYLKNIQGKSYEKLFYDMRGVIEQQKYEYKKQVSDATQSTSALQGFTNPKDNKNTLTMERFVRLLRGSVKGLYRELLSEHATTLITQLTKELKQNPLDAVTYFNRAIVHHLKPDPNYVQTILDYGRAIELEPSLVEAYNNRGVAYANKPSPNYKLAMCDYDRAIDLNPNYARAYSNRGILYAEKSQPDYAQAISDYTRAIELEPNFAIVYFNRGNAYAIKPDPDYRQAISDYTRAIELNPSYVKAYNNRGNVYAERPRPDYTQAISDYNRAIELNPHNEDAYNNRGNAYREKPNPDYRQAISDYTRAIELAPSLKEAYNNRGVSYTKKPDPDYAQAISDHTRAIELEPNYVAAYIDRGFAYISRKLDPDYEKAIFDYTRAIELDPDSAEVYTNRGIVYATKPNPDYEKAISDYTRAIELDPNDKKAYNNRRVVQGKVEWKRLLAKFKRLCRKTH